MRVLLVDDDPGFRTSVAQGLRRSGYEVDTAAGGAEGWASFVEQDYPVVLVDWLMPEMDGLELCRRIRGAQRANYTWIILVSGLGGTDRYLEGMESGADDFVVKPCEPRELDARLRVARRLLSLQSRVHQLEGLLPICSYCKRIRADDDRWFSVEQYLSGRSDAHFTHGVCPTCYVTEVQTDLDAIRRSGL